MSTQSEIQAKVERWMEDVDRQERVVNGTPDDQVVLRDGRVLRTLAWLQRQAGIQIDRATQAADEVEANVELLSNIQNTAVALVDGVMFETVNEGLAATAPNGYFAVIGGNDAVYVTLYRKEGGNAVKKSAITLDPHVDIRSFGAAPDGVTDCSPALATMANAGIKRIKIPAVSGTANTYFFSQTFPLAALDGAVIDVDEGVLISELDGSAGHPAITYPRPMKSYIRLLQVNSKTRPDARLSYDEKRLFLERQDADRTTWAAVACNTSAIKSRLVGWPNGDNWADDAFAASSSNTFRLSGAADGAYHMGMHRMIPGRQIFASVVGLNGNPLLVGGVRWQSPDGQFHYTGIRCNSLPDNAQQIITKDPGKPGFDTPAASYLSGTHATYQGANAEWSIEHENWGRAIIRWNTLPVHEIEVPGHIFEAGYGSYNTAEGQFVEWGNVVLARDLEGGGKIFTAAAFGDSRTDPNNQSAWPFFARRFLDLTQGFRCVRFDDFAVGGQGTAAQLEIMRGVDLGQYSIVHINLGTNDVQGGVPVGAPGVEGSFMDNIDKMAKRVRDAKGTPTFSAFDLWYTQGQAGAGRGQASSNYEKAGPYRSALRRYCAERGYRLLDEAFLSGPVIAHFVNPALNPNFVGQADPWHKDNIHQTSTADRIRGHAVARLILSVLVSRRGLQIPIYGLAGANGWQGSIQQPTLQVTPGGIVHLEGIIDAGANAVHADGTSICPLPAFIRRTEGTGLRFYPVTDNGERGTMIVDTASGDLRIFGYPTAGYFDLSGISFSLDRYL